MTIAESGAGDFRRSARWAASGCRAMWQWTHSIGSAAVKGSTPGEHLVERDAKRVKIAAGIDRAIHPAGLLGRHVGECSGNHLRRFRRLAFARQTRSNAEAG